MNIRNNDQKQWRYSMLKCNPGKLFYMVIFTFLIANSGVLAQTYETPPSSSTYGHVPYISDKAMEQCVILYNKTKWLGQEINNTTVDQYSQASVEAYNEKINQYTNMLSVFNRDCAGKQSESAYRAAQKLNSGN